MKLFFLIFFTVLISVNTYVAHRLCLLLPHSIAGRTIIISFVVICVLSFIGAFVIADKLPVALGTALYKTGNSWLIALLYFSIIFLVLDLLRITNLLSMDWMIRGSLTGFCVVVGGVALLLISGNIVYHNKKRVELNLDLAKNINAAGNNLKVVMISDLHMGYGIGGEEFKRWIELINTENPDIVLIAGDIIDSSARALLDKGVDKLFENIDSRYGTYAVLGNHEYIAGIDKSLEFIGGTNIRLLRDETILIDDRFYLIGRDDRTNKSRKQLAGLTDTLNKSLPSILLDHQPYDFTEAERHGVDIQLSGHTHQGQVWPASLITRAIYENDHGYCDKGDTHFYVSSGLGIWGGKFRIGTRSEYVVINITGI